MLQRQTFKHPGPAYGIHPFWFWNGAMEDAELVHQIEEMADKGVGGFFICPRQGLQIPYLSEAWFGKVRLAVQTAKRLGMEVWLYDEYPYPSGIAGGEVTLAHPEAKLHTLVHRTDRVEGGQSCDLELPWARVLYARAVPVDPDTGELLWKRALDVRGSIGSDQVEPVFQKVGLTAYNRKRFFTYQTVKKLQWTAPEREGQWELHCFLEREIDDFKYYGTYVDPCNEEAMKTFIELTHERYAQTVGADFGTAVKGIFTDEIGLLGALPWSPKLPKFFKERNGYELKDQLPALLYKGHENSSKVRYDYYQTIHLLLRSSYHKQVHDWCEKYGLQYAAEVPSVRMATQAYSHVPSGDSAHEKLGRSLDWILTRYGYSMRYNPKMISSLSSQLSRDRALIECFHSVGWSMTLQDARWMIDRLAAMGINFYNFHAFFYTLDGLTKHDAPPSQFVQNPYWKHFRLLGDYVKRISYVMTLGKPVRPIAVVDPTTSFWTHMGNPFHGFGYGGKDEGERQELEQLKKHWLTICKQLTLNQRDYDHLDPEILTGAEVQDGRIRIGKAEYTLLVLPPMSNLELAAWDKIKQFLGQGGQVIACGLLPHEPIEGNDRVKEEMSEAFGLHGPDGAHRLTGTAEAAGLLSLLDSLQPREVWLESPAHASFLMQQRLMQDGSRLIFVSNQEGGAQEVLLHVEPGRHDTLNGWESRPDDSRERRAAIQVRLLNLETGEAEPVKAKWSGKDWVIPLHFAPYESLLLESRTWLEGRNDHGGREWPGDRQAYEGDWEWHGDGQAGEGQGYQENQENQGNQENQKNQENQECRECLDAPTAASSTLTESGNRWIWEVDAGHSWKVNAEQDNVLRLDTFELSLAQEAPAANTGGSSAGWSESTVVEAKTFIDQCEDLAAGKRLPLQFTQQFGTPMKIQAAYPIRCRYTVDFQVKCLPKSCYLLMDQGALSGDYVLYINEHAVTRNDLKPRFVYDHSNRAADIHSKLRLGLNTVRVEMTVEHDWDGLVDALYLCGDFAVEFDDGLQPVLTDKPEEMALHDSCERQNGPYPGYPYYAGTLVFRQEVELAQLPGTDRFALRFFNWNAHFHECAEVLVNGNSLGVRAWTPYEWTGSTDALRVGLNTVEVKVTNTLIGMLEGKYFDYEAHTLQDVRQAGG